MGMTPGDKHALVRSILEPEPVAGPPQPAMPPPGVDAGPSAGGQLSPEDAGYRPDGLSCANCAAFQGEGQPCMKVAAPIAAIGYCNVHSELVGGSMAPAPEGEEAPPEPEESEEEEVPPEGVEEEESNG